MSKKINLPWSSKRLINTNDKPALVIINREGDKYYGDPSRANQFVFEDFLKAFGLKELSRRTDIRTSESQLVVKHYDNDVYYISKWTDSEGKVNLIKLISDEYKLGITADLVQPNEDYRKYIK